MKTILTFSNIVRIVYDFELIQGRLSSIRILTLLKNKGNSNENEPMQIYDKLSILPKNSLRDYLDISPLTNKSLDSFLIKLLGLLLQYISNRFLYVIVPRKVWYS